MNKVNYSDELEKIISDTKPFKKLLLHCCCAPCSSYCLTYLVPYFDITCFFYNPNITDEDEYKKRLDEMHRLVGIINGMTRDPAIFGEDDGSSVRFPEIKIIDGKYEPDLFLDKVKSSGLESCPEGGRRCETCFNMRLAKTYEMAVQTGSDYFTTTLSISPHKDAQLLNTIGYDIQRSGAAAGDTCTPMWLPSDFKKKDGYKISIELSRRFDLYRQNYCGCIYSK